MKIYFLSLFFYCANIFVHTKRINERTQNGWNKVECKDDVSVGKTSSIKEADIIYVWRYDV